MYAYRVVAHRMFVHFLERHQRQCTIPVTILASFHIFVDWRSILSPAADWDAWATFRISTFFVMEIHVNVRELDNLRKCGVCLHIATNIWHLQLFTTLICSTHFWFVKVKLLHMWHMAIISHWYCPHHLVNFVVIGLVPRHIDLPLIQTGNLVFAVWCNKTANLSSFRVLDDVQHWSLYIRVKWNCRIQEPFCSGIFIVAISFCF